MVRNEYKYHLCTEYVFWLLRPLTQKKKPWETERLDAAGCFSWIPIVLFSMTGSHDACKSSSRTRNWYPVSGHVGDAVAGSVHVRIADDYEVQRTVVWIVDVQLLLLWLRPHLTAFSWKIPIGSSRLVEFHAQKAMLKMWRLRPPSQLWIRGRLWKSDGRKKNRRRFLEDEGWTDTKRHYATFPEQRNFDT